MSDAAVDGAHAAVTEEALEFADVETAEKRAGGALVQVCGEDGVEERSVEVEEGAGGAGELHARDEVGTGDVKKAGGSAVNQGEGGGGEVLVVGGRGELIGRQTHAAAGGKKAAQGVEEVFRLGVGPVDGRGAEDESAGVSVEDGALSVKLGAAVDGQGMGEVFFGVGAGRAVENVVGGEEDKGDVAKAAGESEGAGVVGGGGPGGVGFAALDVCGAGGAEDRGDFVCGEGGVEVGRGGCDGLEVEEERARVELAASGGEGGGAELLDQGGAELT